MLGQGEMLQNIQNNTWCSEVSYFLRLNDNYREYQLSISRAYVISEDNV